MSKNIYAESELTEAATTEDFSVVQNEVGRFVVSSICVVFIKLFQFETQCVSN